jgi:hypothetical protein
LSLVSGEGSLALTSSLRSLFGLALILIPLLIFQRLLHREIQGLFLIITRSQPVSLAVYSLLFLPGVFLHEVSHFLAAKLLGVRTGRFSVYPAALPDGRLRLGYVETARTDIARDALIGAAPLFAGGLFIAWTVLRQVGLPVSAQPLASTLTSLLVTVRLLPSSPDFWIWFYLVFAVSSTMFPSASDRRSWLPALLAGSVLVGVVFISGAAPWLAQNAAPGLIRALQSITAIFVICLGVTLALLVPVWLFRLLASRLTGLRLQ